MKISNEHFDSLAAKINGLDLSGEEQAALGYLLGAGRNEDDVEGFGVVFEVEVKGFNIGMPPASKFNIGMPPTVRSSSIVYNEVEWT